MTDQFDDNTRQTDHYQVTARNTAADSENKIHDTAVAARFGFRGGLVPGVTVYAYMTVPLVERFPDWLEHGAMRVTFQQPFYEGDIVNVISEVVSEGPSSANAPPITLRAENGDGILCATGEASVDGSGFDFDEPLLEDFPQHPLPPVELRPRAIRENLIAGSPLGSWTEPVSIPLLRQTYLQAIDERLPIYYGADAVVHPGYLLGRANEIFVRNFVLEPWIHVGSQLKNWSTLRDGEELSVRGRIRECFERKGHEFAVLDVLLLANHTRLVQQVRHTAIYKVGGR